LLGEPVGYAFAITARHPRLTRSCAWRELPGGSRLRALRPDDAEELHASIETNRPHLAAWLPWAAGQTFEDTVEFLDRVRQQMEANDGFQLALTRDDRIVGVAGFHGVDWGNRSTAIGYWLALSEQGRGTMTKAVRALVDHALGEWRLNRVEIRAASENRRSRAICERLGFREEATLRRAERVGERHLDVVVYSLLACEWKVSRRLSSRPPA
jgi:ribosomal-protein-serine acetyltransferase